MKFPSFSVTNLAETTLVPANEKAHNKYNFPFNRFILLSKSVALLLRNGIILLELLALSKNQYGTKFTEPVGGHYVRNPIKSEK